MGEIVYVALGSNLGDRVAYLAAARAAISLIPKVRLIAASSVEETAPLGPAAQGPYLNQMIALETSRDPAELLRALQKVERTLGRLRGARWGPRTIDLDIVRFGTRTMQEDELALPHPGFDTRAFWQREVAELDSLVKAGDE